MTAAIVDPPAPAAAASPDAPETPPPGVDPDVFDQINKGVDEAVAAIAKQHKERAKKALPSEKDPPDDDEGDDVPSKGEEDEGAKDDDPEKGAKPGEITDAHFERAVKAGLTMADAREFRTPEALDRMIARLEAKSGEGDGKPPADAKKDEEADPLADFPDLDPEVYDEKVVKGFKTLKEIVKGLLSSKQDRERSKDAEWFSNQVKGLGKEAAAELGKAGVADSLKDKLAVLSAGYKAAGKSVEREAVFKEAVAIVLGDAAARDAQAVTADKLRKRGTQHISRPSGNRSAPASDVFSDTAAELDRKYFGRK
jgi:hypothetical protein